MRANNKKTKGRPNLELVAFPAITLFIFAGIFLLWYFFIDDTIRLSKKPGFYEEAFDLRIRTKLEYELHYTTDGTQPTLLSPLCGGPIHIDDPSDNPNIYSARTDTSGFFVTEFSGVEIYKAPDYNIDKCIPLRVASFDKDGELKKEIFANYFVGMDEKTGYDGLYTVSLITEPDNLFGKKKGIYVLGKLFENYLEEEGELSSYVRSWEANYNETGKDWEREAHFTIFDPSGRAILDDNAGVRIQGKGSRKNNQKSLGFYAREDYGGSDRFMTSLFGRTKGTHKIKLSCGGQDEFLKLKDYLIETMIAESNLEIGTLSMIPATVFIDGEYWGVYYITEAINADYVESHYGIDPDNCIIINAEELTHGNDGDKELYYDTVYDFARQYGAEDPGLFDHICTYLVDIESFVDFYAVELYLCNTDWPLKNAACWRARDTLDAQYTDGKWRYIIYDVNMEGVMQNPEEETLSQAMRDDALFAAFMTNPQFQQMLLEKVDELESGIFSWDNVYAHVEDWRNLMEEPLKKSSMRFAGTQENADIDHRIEQMQSFFEKRGPVLKSHIQMAIDGKL